MKNLSSILGLWLLIGACSSVSRSPQLISAAGKEARPETAAVSQNQVQTQTGSFRKVAWDSCGLNTGDKTHKIIGFNLKVLDSSHNKLATKFVPILRKTKREDCQSFEVGVQKVFPKTLARLMKLGKFNGFIYVSSVDKAKLESSPTVLQVAQVSHP